MGYFKHLYVLSTCASGSVGAALLLSFAPQKVQAEPMHVSWYGPGFDGNYTASGEVFDRYSHTAAHPSWPFGTLVQLTNYNTGAVVTVRINNRSGSALDLAEQAARDLGTYHSGTASVDVEIVQWGE
ncbi:MAG: septal ring lytic transglycosylase RlpA family protein [Phormidesmis sp.]